MQKIKKPQRVLTILFLIYLIISFCINFGEIYIKSNIGELYSYSTEELRQNFEREYNEMTFEEKQKIGNKTPDKFTDKEIEAVRRRIAMAALLTITAVTLSITFIKNIMIIVIYIAVKIANKRSRIGKLDKEDFSKSIQYYRNILKQERIRCIIVD